ncbi:tRNA methyltransferase 10 homolog A-like [Liolophura sinensis]|uniref:tRNA methyltransferase 10 homolog A-like n=1 Tax=Liolophura sinensis TaxID=3198878 RepID=UPI003158ED5A
MDCTSGEQVSEGQAEEGNSAETPISKNQLKRLRKQKKWLESKGEKRKKEKEKRKRKIAEARARGESLGPTRKSLKENSMKNSACKIRVVIDCSFDKYMNDKDTMKLVKQIQHCYSVNRRSANPLQFYLCCSDGKTKERLDRIGDYKNWDVNFRDDPLWDVFEREEIVYLTSDSPNVLTELQPDKAYIVGGLVDHNHEKGLCHRLAEEKSVSHAQLPIGDYVKLNSRKVLTVNHVFEILLRYTETGNWENAFYQVIPQRKTVKLEVEKNTEPSDCIESEESEDIIKCDKNVQDIREENEDSKPKSETTL